MSAAALVATLAMGGLVGVVSGLLGIGGGVLIVPFLYLLFHNPEWSGALMDPEVRVAVAHATSLAVIIPASLSGLRTFQQFGLVEWKVVLPMGMAAAVAAVAGASVAVSIPGRALEVGFALLLLAVGVRLLVPSERERIAQREGEAGVEGVRLTRGSRGVAMSGGVVVGFLSALLGVGGGMIAIPYLLHVVGLELKKVAAASIGVIAFAAPAGALAFAFSGSGSDGVAPASLGYIFLPAAGAMLPGALLGARLGARWNRSANRRLLASLLAVLLLVTGVRLLWP
ncbi:MAG: sulfite exporter TauE/SafE family protein [Gemmatimonadota bacterium]